MRVTCACTCFLIAAMAAAAPLTTVQRDAALPRVLSHQPVPKFCYGFTIGYDSERSIVWKLDNQGTLLTEVTLGNVLTDAHKIQIGDVAVSPQGNVAVTASIMNAEGSFVSVIVWLAQAGEVDRIVRTSPFAPFRLAFASDGRLWALGRVHDSNFNETETHDTLRQYDSEGRLVRTLLPRQSFASEARHPGNRSFLVASHDRVGLYTETANEWVEVSLEGDIVGRWKTIPLAPVGSPTGAALTSSGGFYLSVQLSPSRVPKTAQGRSSVIKLYRLDKPSGKFLPIDMPEVDLNSLSVILGSDGDSLVWFGLPSKLLWIAVR